MNKLIIIYFIILFVIVISIILKNNIIVKNNFEVNHPACNNKLTDKEYLEHMIPHHQVAIDISIILQKTSKWDVMQDILRKLIWTQNYEIMLMNEMLKSMPNNISSSTTKMNKYYQTTNANFTKPNKIGLINAYCDPNFFNPEAHMEHIKHMNLDENMYIAHMIPHHQVAVDMSKKLLKNTNNDFMIYLAYRIIRSQEAEIIMLNDLKNNKKFESNLI